MRKRFIKWLSEKMIWIRWLIQTLFIVTVIILGMVYGWGLTPKRWTVVIISYLIANALIPFCAYLNYSLVKKMGWTSIKEGYHIHKNPVGSGRKKKEIDPFIIATIAEEMGRESPLEDGEINRKSVQQAAKEYYEKEAEREM